MLPITVDQVKAVIAHPSSDDALINSLIGVVSDSVERYCKRIFTKQDYDQYYSGFNNTELVLLQRPVNSITSITDKDGVASWTDYFLDSEAGIVELRSGYLTKGVRNIRVKYNAGYEALPDNLKHACITFISLLREDRAKERVGLRERNFGDGGTVSFVQTLPWEIVSVLNSYRNFGS